MNEKLRQIITAKALTEGGDYTPDPAWVGDALNALANGWVPGITLHQPYASLIAMGLKQWETRHWRTHQRGWVLIDGAARKPRRAELEAIAARLPGVEKEAVVTELKRLNIRGTVCLARLGRCAQMTHDAVLGDPYKINLKMVSQVEKAFGNWESGRYAFEFNRIIPISQPLIVPLSGIEKRRRWWRADADFLEKIAAQIREVSAA